MAAMSHWERVEAAIRGDTVDRVPISLWHHWPDQDQDPKLLADVTVNWQNTHDFDLVKFMPTGTYSVEDWGVETVYKAVANGTRTVLRFGVSAAAQWPKLARLDAKAPYLARQIEALRLAALELQNSVPILQTIFSPLTTARKLTGDRVIDDLREHPALLEAGLEIITQTTIDFALASLQAGAHGMFLASQCSTYDYMTEDEYRRFGMRYDLQILDALRGKCRFNMLHVHGENVMFDLMASYPCEMLNWHDRRTQPDLRGGFGRFKGLLVGGVNEWGTLLKGTPAQIENELAEAIAQTGGRRLMLAPGCVCPLAVPPGNYRIATDYVSAPRH